jgi:hypothetical protein
MDENKQAQEAIEEVDAKPTQGLNLPVAGPHAKERLTDKSKTPGAGTLSDGDDENATPGTG